jgi:hypothetical protein
MSDHKGAALMLPSLPHAQDLLGDKGYNSNRFRQALIKRGITPCILGQSIANFAVGLAAESALDLPKGFGYRTY